MIIKVNTTGFLVGHASLIIDIESPVTIISSAIDKFQVVDFIFIAFWMKNFLNLFNEFFSKFNFFMTFLEVRLLVVIKILPLFPSFFKVSLTKIIFSIFFSVNLP